MDKLILPIVSVCLTVIDGLAAVHHYIVQNQKVSKPTTQNEAHTFLQDLIEKVQLWLRQNHQFASNSSRHLLASALKVWDNVINLELQGTELKERWEEMLLGAFEDEICLLDSDTSSKVFMIGTDLHISDVLKERLTSSAFHSFEEQMMKNPSNVPQTRPFGLMMSRMLEKQWPKNHNEDELLDFVLKFQPLSQYFERFYGKEGDLLTRECIELLTIANSLLSLTTQTILEGSICVGNLKNILSQKENILKLVEAAEANFSDPSANKTDIHHLNRVLEVREKELQYCDQYLKHADVLMSCCAHLRAVNTAEIARIVSETLATMNEKQLDKLVDHPAVIKTQDKFDITTYRPSVNMFCIPHNLLLVIPHLEKLMQSGLFQTMWHREGNSDTLSDSLDSVLLMWKFAKQKWDALSKDIRNGTISFQDIHKHVDNFHDNYEKIRHEFTLMNDDNVPSHWVEERIQQLKTFSILNKSRKTASEILNIQQLFGFEGDFKPIHAILNLTKRGNVAMKDMDQSVLETCSLLESVTDKQIESLAAFKESKPLVDWLRKSMKDGLKELKVFVDLAYISAGEGDIEIHKVNCLHAATTGYAPLVFDCDEQCDYAKFFERCKLMWRELQTNPDLPQKLRDTAQHLEWLKEVSQSHGSVEVTSLSQAEMINSKGVYHIGNINDNTVLPQLDFDNVISLHVMPDCAAGDVKNVVRKYSYNQLVDLQSRLMLVAGRAQKGKETVDQFMMILDGIVRLAKFYIKLISDGCVLFKCWNAEFFCEKSRYACAILSFGESSEPLKGYRRNHQLEDFINALANVFEDCHMEWLKYLSDKRDQYLELNFFTISQLVFLQKELIKIGTNVEPSDLVFPLLSLIKSECSMSDIQHAMQSAKDEIFQIEKTEESAHYESEDAPLQNVDVEQNFIQEVIKNGFTETLAQAAFKHVEDQADIDSGVVWCLEHCQDEEFQSSTVDPVEATSDASEERFSGWTSEESSFASRAALLVQNLPEQFRQSTSVDPATLTKNIEHIWKTFLGSVSSSVADYLSVEHLGIILHKLALSCDQCIDRKLPVQLKPRTPNLIVCQNSDMLNAVLYLYMKDPSKPLPQPDEVLLCTPETSFDEVDIFLRRAFFSSLGKIHCLAYADLLRYETEEKVEKKIIDYINVANAKDCDYKLVVLCSSENEFRARLVAALDRHRCQPPIIRVKNIKDYLTEKFTAVHIEEDKSSASYIDFSHSTVRVVKSKRAGIGKTLYKKRRVAELRELNPMFRAKDLSVSIPLYEKNVVMAQVADRLLPCTLKPGQVFPRVFHLNISYEVQEGLDYLLFNLLILGKVSNEKGHIWLRSAMDLYLVEIIPISDVRDHRNISARRLIHPIFEILPHVTCWSPQDSLQILTKTSRPDDYEKNDLLFDVEEFRSVVYQRPFQYLLRQESKASLSDIDPSTPQGDPAQCLITLLRHCGVPDPSWAELHHFVWFLNTQLCDFERSAFCSPELQDDLPGFSLFVLKFLIQMSRDFATRSLNMSEETPIGDVELKKLEEGLIQHEELMELEAEPVEPDDEPVDFEDEPEEFEDEPEDEPEEFEDEPEDLEDQIMEHEEDVDEPEEFEDEPEDLEDQLMEHEEDVIYRFQMRRTWESSPHPYIFFNPDGHTMTFLGFNIDRQTGDLIDQQTGIVLERRIMPQNLQTCLHSNKVPLNENFDQLQRMKRLEKLYNVMAPGFDYYYDPDPTYELTTDNVKKILAIFMRFRCNIPVLIMGETGCGKTRLVKFLCSLQCPPGVEVQNMVTMKVHGGTTADDIVKKVHKAEQLAQANAEINEHMYTVLFFDEANTTESIGLIKEIMCDGTMDGQPLQLSDKLKIVAACNPYRKHSDELIQRLEKAGLGYHVDAEKTTDKLGRVPMRRLVYRVQPLPQSMLPLVWDFGQLNTTVEELYIRQMVNHYVNSDMLPRMIGLVEVVSSILIQSQNFMRQQEDECSFVSLRDVERVLKVMSWFYEQSQDNRILFDMMEEEETQQDEESEVSDDEEEEEEEETNARWPDDLTKSLILALGVCYRASLRSRDEYDDHVISFFQNPCSLPGGVRQFVDVITRCQDVFLENVQLEENIARNQALKENLFMMIICIELRIPLFLVGKPGSSKSLAKTIVSDAMQGNTAKEELFKQLKQAQMVSFQCSPLSVAEGILGTFRQCAQFQKDKDLDRFVSIVVLDEVGLAEDSVRMPLKTLHPLLEDGCHGDETPEPYKKVAFIGISNWALDPAKMNRGILVQREVPDEMELLESAEGICASNPGVLQSISVLLPELAEAYKAVFEENLHKREFFGLRDFYSLVKMVYAFAAQQPRPLCWHQLEHSVRRNFGGLDTVDPVEIFKDKITTVSKREKQHENDPVNTTAGLIEAALFGDGTGSENRYLLLLTENYGALGILQQMLSKHRVVTIFGSSFPKDQEYTQVCRNINRIKVCMETGNTVILLNLENLYESLYDALNQYYSRFGGERFVDLGLGTHRVKCRVHRDFKLIVVAEKQIVYEKFPIPLINRLEKHFLRLNNIMDDRQSHFAVELDFWANRFVTKYQTGFNREETVNVADAFMGYHPDTTAAIVLHLWNEKDCHDADKFFEDCKKMLLWCATPDAVLRLTETRLYNEKDWVLDTYFREQPHDDIFKYMMFKLDRSKSNSLYAQVTTHSKLLTDQEKKEILTYFDLTANNIILLTLQSFDTEQQFCQQIRNFVEKSGSGLKVMLIQCGSGDKNMSLIKSAQYCVVDELPPDDREFAVFFIVQLPRVAGGCFTGFMAGKWHSLHIDELRPEGNLPSVHQLYNNTPANVLQGRAPREEPSRVTPNDTQMGPLNMDSHLAREVQQHEEMELTENTVDQENVDRAAVDLDNIVLEEVPQEEVTPMDVEQPDTSLPAYFQDLILRCIQSAAALVKDDVQDSKRSTKRIEILLYFLEDPNYESAEFSFLVGLSNMIIRLQEEKEVEVSGPTAGNWLAKEAAKPDNVKKAGTFRRSWLQCLENKIVTVLAGVVAFLDTNRNLDIIRDMPSDHWAHILWLRILHSPSVCQLHYKDLLSPETHQELGEIIPYNTGVHGMPFTAELPFSWLLQQLIENALANAEYSHLQESEEISEEHAVLAFVSPLILKTPYGNLLNVVSAERGSNQKEIIMAYIKDFVHTKYLCSSSDKHQILCEALYISSRQARMDITSLDLMPALVAVHCTHSLVMGRLQAFQDIEQVWPQVLDAVCQMREQGRHALLRTEEMTLDVLGLSLLLEQLEPQKEQLNKERGRTEWLEKVKTFLPVIQRILDNVDNVDLDLGPVCLEYMQIVRCLWTRVITMKLFLESFSAKENKKVSENLVARCMPLWQLLGPRADLKTIKSLDKVETFLRSVNTGIFQKVSEKLGSCSYCASTFQAPPIMLPCKDKICKKCYNDLRALDRQCCPTCHRDIPANFNFQSTSAKNDISAEHQLFQQCCNTFLMAVVSNLCFGGDTAPEDAVIEKILTYITRKTSSQGPSASERLQTKQMTVFDDLVDPTPVVRSFLLKLLIHKSGDHVQEHLEDFLKQAEKLRQQTLHNSGILQFIIMVIQCLEDQLHETAAMKDFDSEMKMATQYLSLAYQCIESANIDMAKLQTIANARFGLMTVAKYLHMLVIEESIMKSSVFTKMLSQARDLIEIENFDWPKKFFIKQLCREFGTDSYHRICQWGKTPWLAIEEPTEKVKECPDRYVVCSLHYQKIRDMVAKTLLGEDVTRLESIISETASPLNQMYLFLAIHHEVTLKYIQSDVQQDQALAKAVENLDTFADNTESISNIDLHQLLQNHFGQQTHLLNFQPGQSLRDQSILCMLFHFSLVLRNCPEKKNFLHPLIAMATNPALFTDTLLPTMPQDDIKKMKAIILESVVKEDSNAQVVVYRCPNGHPYVITECGRPYTEGRCNECGSKIGGVSHKAFEGNVQDSGTDQTKTGHILGDANQRPNISPSERKLSSQACALLRLLTHAALLLGCDINLENSAQDSYMYEFPDGPVQPTPPVPLSASAGIRETAAFLGVPVSTPMVNPDLSDRGRGSRRYPSTAWAEPFIQGPMVSGRPQGRTRGDYVSLFENFMAWLGESPPPIPPPPGFPARPGLDQFADSAGPHRPAHAVSFPLRSAHGVSFEKYSSSEEDFPSESVCGLGEGSVPGSVLDEIPNLADGTPDGDYDYQAVLGFVQEQVRLVCADAIPSEEAVQSYKGVSFGNRPSAAGFRLAVSARGA
ncbi:E3 ubiquitin-protein ligase rnf213-alpha-like [Gigantopelta aegis]|uniref:E3 ubiquitin-protein ligase rnf213-alpha-like n=1 Tax=Gigantopelta aegis TaxID=1735272 RepID=UPI001B88A974|nr:E3 ubiquitin-protein ligase rnf213-alpha-like [Gigantopelta aegis]